MFKGKLVTKFLQLSMISVKKLRSNLKKLNVRVLNLGKFDTKSKKNWKITMKNCLSIVSIAYFVEKFINIFITKTTVE